MTVAEAQERISSSEFSEWKSFYSLHPFGDRRADQRSANTAMWSFVAMNGSKEAKDIDFMLPNYSSQRKELEQPNDLEMFFKAIADDAEKHKRKTV